MEQRYTKPGRYDKAPYGTIAEVLEDEHRSLWVQLSKEDDKYDWQPINNLIGRVFERLLEDENFLNLLLLHYPEKHITLETLEGFIKLSR